MCWPVGKADHKSASVTPSDVTLMTEAMSQDILARCQYQGVLGYYPKS